MRIFILKFQIDCPLHQLDCPSLCLEFVNYCVDSQKKITKIVATRCHIFRLKCAKIRSQEPHPSSASIFGHSGYRLRRLRRLVVPPSTTIPPNTGAARIHTVLKLSLSASITGPWLTYSVCLAPHCVLPNLSAVFMLGPTRVRDDIYAQVAKHCSAQTTPVM